ncbi:MAG: filamentous hemagglutinin family protein [Burkholderiales bacterium]|nr:filamentous hemagglutinin family protein [Burkholderiales bacterium]
MTENWPGATAKGLAMTGNGLEMTAKSFGMTLMLLAAAPAHAAPPLPVPCAPCSNAPAGQQGFVQAGVVNAPVTSGNTYTITQKSPTAILNWQSFNIDKGYSVNFNQPSATASVLNRIWSGNPSIIAGQLNAQGQVYLVNQNGIVFANGAQVNVSGLIASSLDIADSVYKAGYLVPDFSKNQIHPAFSITGLSGTGGFIRVDTGASINGSRIMMFAPVVENNGTISTTDGQAVLAAGHKVYFEASQDPNLRGVLVEVDVTNQGHADTSINGQVKNNAAGTVTNAGSILSQRGNVTLVGYAVNQQGMVSATTSVNQNGSIKLLARHSVAPLGTPTYNYSQEVKRNPGFYDIRATQTGNVTLAKGSVTAVTPEPGDNSTTTDGQGFNPSIIEVMGKTVNVAGSIIAPGGKVNLVAAGSIDPTVGSVDQSGTGLYQEINSKLAYSSFLNPNYKPVSGNDGARVFLDNGSIVDVSGSSASVSVARNILSVQLRGSQMADAPMQKNGFLWGKNVYIDIRKGSTLANITGDEAQIGRTVAERTSSGGQVLIASTVDAIMNPGATVDISGGKVNYTGAYIDSTTLFSKGVAYDISNASPNLIYDGMGGTYSVVHSKWGVTETWNTMGGGARSWDPGYVQGMAAGSVTLMASNAAIEGRILSKTVAGSYQRQPYVDPATLAANNYRNTWQMLPNGGTLTLGYKAGAAVASRIIPGTTTTSYITGNDVVVQTNPQQTNYAVGDALSSTSPIVVDSGLFSSNIDNLAVYTNGSAGIAAGTALNLAPGGSLALQGKVVNMLGSINAPGGSIALKTVAAMDQLPGAVTVNGNISTRGTWTNDSQLLGAPDFTRPIIVNGGGISLASGGDLNIISILDASGGGWVDQSGRIHGGNGGNVRLAGNISALDGTALSSYGVGSGKGGSFSLGSAADVQIGGSAPNGTLLLPAAFFQSGGFSSYSVASSFSKAPFALLNNGLTVTGPVQPKSQTLILNQDAASRPSGTDVYALSSPGFLPDWQRNPASITLIQATNGGGGLTIDSGASIRVDPRASITLTANNQLTVLGMLDAPAGTINLSLTLPSTTVYAGNQSIWLGQNSRLLAQGYFMQSQPSSNGLVQGQVLPGGMININNAASLASFVVAQQGSVMDVSGTSANIDLPQMNSGSLIYARTHVAGDAGTISVTAVDGAIFDGSMKGGVEAGSQAAAGSFSLNLNGKQFSNTYDAVTPGTANSLLNSTSWNLALQASGGGSFAAKAGLIPGDDKAAGKASLVSMEGQAFLDASTLASFDQVSLKSYNSINLADTVNLATRRSIVLDSPVIKLAGNASVASGHVTLGNLDAGNQPANAPIPTAGAGSLTVSAQLVDLAGNFAISGANSVSISSNGDIRLNGVLDPRTYVLDSNKALVPTTQSLTGSLSTQGNVVMQASQVYTGTLAQFKLSVEDATGAANGSITVQSGGAAPSPVLSAGGSLTLSAANIFQNGVLKAPTGTINLNGVSSVALGAGSVTSVSAEGQIVPFGSIQGGKTWNYDLNGNGTLVQIAAPPQKIVKLTGPNIAVAKGATVDLSGSGDLYAGEFFAGTGGSTNVLDPSSAPANTYAILPGLSGYSPYDPQSAGQYQAAGSKTTLKDGAMVYLAGGAGLKAGYYSLLPASYALLPGAYRVTAVSGYQDMQPGQGASALPDGTQIMAGKYAVAGTSIQDARWSGFAVSSGGIVRTQSEFHDSFANAFFAAQAASTGAIAPRSPIDAGQLVVNASGAGATLNLSGTFNTSSGGRGAWVDFKGSGFDIVNAAGTGAAGFVELTSATLNALGAESLLIGGTRTQTAGGMAVSVGADSVLVENGAAISGPEIILAANNTVAVKAGSSIQGTGKYSGTPQNIAISGDGALLRVSSSNQVTVTRSNVANAKGKLTVENGATVSSTNSVLLDATQATNAGDGANFSGKSFSVAASAIDIGAGSSGVNSLSLTPALLGQMQAFQDITLHSYNDINFYGAAALGGVDAGGRHRISSLTLNAKSLAGINNAGSTATIDASGVTFMNGNGALTSSASGAGTLNVNADKIILADGAKTIQGFDGVALNAAQQIVGQGTGSLHVASSSNNTHSLALSGVITGAAKSDQSIVATGYDTLIQGPSAAAPANADIGAKFAVTGKSIMDKGVISLSAGALTLHATGASATDGVVLDGASQTSAAGASKAIGGQIAYASAGSIALISDKGNVSINSGAKVDVSGNGGDAGALAVSAVNGTVSIAGNLNGSAASGRQGSFVLDTGSLASVTMLDNLLNAGGFTQLIDMRVRSGSLALDSGSVVKAGSFHLAADNGSIAVNGKVDASGANGGDILFAANSDVVLGSGAILDAHGITGNGGKVALEAANGAVNLMNGAYMNVSGANQGTVLLRALQNAAGTDVAVDTLAGTSINVNPLANVVVEGYKNYDAGRNVVANTISAADLMPTSAYYLDAQNFAGNSSTIKARLGMTGLSNMHVVSGIQISSAADLTLASNWDLSTWRFSDGNGNNTEPGILTLKAAGNLNFGTVVTTVSSPLVTTTQTVSGTQVGISTSTTQTSVAGATSADTIITTTVTTTDINAATTTVTVNKTTDTSTTASLSDGFKSVGSGAGGSNVFALSSGPSWSYRLVAGSDSTSANVMAVNNSGNGNVALAPGGYIPGTPSYTNKRGYHPGTPATTNFEMIRTGTGTVDIAAGGGLYLGNSYSTIYTAGQLAQGLPSSLAASPVKAFTTGGGDVNIAVKGNISAVGQNGQGSAVTQLITTDWLQRQTSANGGMWWVDFGSFAQNIGALGGGNVNISAGGNITSLSAMAPTTGYVDASGATQTLGGGNLTVKAGGNIDSGIFYVGNGQGSIRAGGAMGTSRVDPSTTLYTILALGQGSFDVRTGGDLNLQTVMNPTLLGTGSVFSTYNDAGSVSLTSLNGNVLLSNLTTFFSSAKYTTATAPYIYVSDTTYGLGAATLYPGTLNVTALNGSISKNNSMTLFPSSTGNMKFLAGSDINLNGFLTMSDVGSGALQPATPLTTYTDAMSMGHGVAAGTQSPLHNADNTGPVVIAAGGSINGDNTIVLTPNLTLPKSAVIQAGQDIMNLSLSVQNMQNSDATSVTAGRDILYTPNANSPSSSTMGITVSGPGQFVMQAGRNVDLGQSAGLLTDGNLSNPYLPDAGAGVTVLAGAGNNAAGTQAFIGKYIDPARSATYGTDLVSFVNAYASSPVTAAADAYAAFGKMPANLQNAFVNQVFFSELRASGRNAINTGNYNAGYGAIATLFPATYQGDVNLYYSQIKTVRGGDINILTPGGGVNAGLANPSSLGPQKTASELGIVTVKGGNVNAFVNNDFLVNQSRVFTLQGGNILMWSSYGNLDAGKGSKTVSSTPPPILTVDPKTGTFNVDVTQSVVGSGIRVLLANKNVIPGSVDLFAPSGVINAGDAGIGAAGNIFLGALHVVGADNINFGGVAAGVPVTTTTSMGGLAGVGNFQGASQAAEQATQKLGNQSDMSQIKAALANFKPLFLSVDVIGLGGEALVP